MAYLELLTPFFINLVLIEAKLFPQSPQFASNILRFGEDKLTKMLLEPNNTTILMSAVIKKMLQIKPLRLYDAQILPVIVR